MKQLIVSAVVKRVIVSSSSIKASQIDRFIQSASDRDRDVQQTSAIKVSKSGIERGKFFMYHAIVRRKLTENFTGLSQETIEQTINGMAPHFEHTFAGTHAIGGTRHTTAGMRLWFERVYRLLPDLKFAVKDIAVSGWPWNTTVVAEWHNTATSASGDPYVNDGVHIVCLRWGKIVSMHAYTDTEVLASLCRLMADRGIAEASAPPIED
jgi:ketosteroid isomerase-like protein